MARGRYFYWLFLLNSLINIINFVPRQLIDNRFGGAQMSIVIAVVLGSLFIYLLMKLLGKFPGKGVPEIFGAAFPKPVVSVLVAFFSLLWCMAGIITLLSFVDITMRYISPDTGPYTIMLGFLIVVCLCIRLDSLSLLYGLEVMLGFTLPIILYSTVKALTNPDFSWDAVLQVITYSWHMPDIKSLAAATFTFSGYINMAIFNRVFGSLKLKHLWIISLEGFLVLILTFFVPIGYHGTVGVERHVYTWFSTADSIGIETFLIERMLFIFYFAYLSLSLVSVIIHWHVGKELMLSMFPSSRKKNTRIKRWREYMILGLFGAATLSLMRMDQFQLNEFGVAFLYIRWAGELLMILLVFYCYLALRRRKS